MSDDPSQVGGPGSCLSDCECLHCRADRLAAPEPPPMKRACFVPAPHIFNLNHACNTISDAYAVLGCGYGHCYLVGSSLRKRDYRDVDVRLILDDAHFDRLFPGAQPGPYMMHSAWSLTCAAISCWLREQTGLPVDFQIQRMTEANAEYSRKDGHGGRYPLGMFRAPVETPQ